MDYESDYYENILKNTHNREEIKRAHSILEEFIISKGLIITGGTAVDMALRLKGHTIYTDTKQMDYDVYSHDNVNDAYLFGSILCKNGFKNVSCINAIHMGTMAVRIDFIGISDFSYCPLNIFKKIPTLTYNKFIIVHPHWQMIDQHSALSYPYQNPGREVIFQRWEKDMKRYDLLYKYYPILPNITEKTGGKTTKSKTSRKEKRVKELKSTKKEVKLTIITVDIAFLENAIISGWGSVSYSINGNNVIINIPKGESLSLASHDYKAYIEKNNLVIKSLHCQYVGKLPQYVKCNSDIKDSDGDTVDIEIFDIYGLLLSATKINDTYNVWVCCMQWSMLYLLIKTHISDDEDIINIAKKMYIECIKKVIDGNCPSPIVCGTHNYSRDFIQSLNRTKALIYNIPIENKRPSNKYPLPPLCEITERYDTILDRIDGGVVNKLIEYNVNPYADFTILSIKHKQQ